MIKHLAPIPFSQRTCTKYSIKMFFFCRKPNKKRKKIYSLVASSKFQAW
jgi:hypothetical protein